jgi:hypothetical protein
MGKVLNELRSELQLIGSMSTDVPVINTMMTQEASIQSNGTSSEQSTEVMATVNEPDHHEDSSGEPEVPQPDSTAKTHQVLLIGDSNLREVELDLTELNARVKTLHKPGAKTSDVEQLIELCDINAHDVSIIMLHIGTCDWSSDDKSAVESGEAVLKL